MVDSSQKKTYNSNAAKLERNTTITPNQESSSKKAYGLTKSGSQARLQKSNETPFKQSKFAINDSAMKQAMKKAQTKKQKAEVEVVADEAEQQSEQECSEIKIDFSPGKLDKYMVQESSQKVEMDNFIKMKQVEIETLTKQPLNSNVEIDFSIIEKLKKDRIAMLQAQGNTEAENAADQANLHRDQIIQRIQAELQEKQNM